MRVSISIEYDASPDREGETEDEKQRVLDVVGEEFEGVVESIRRRCEAEGLHVNVST